MTSYYVEAYDEDGFQILGNMDGQGFFECKDYKRCDWYKRLANLKTLSNRVQQYKVIRGTEQQIFNGNGTLVATIANMTHPSWY